MRIWKNTRWDALLLAFSVAQLAATLWLAVGWTHASALERAGGFALLVFMMTYNIIVVSHLFTHLSWFTSPLLNGLASMLNSVDIGQSVQVYEFTHVRNHHRYNNDAKGENGTTRDTSSTYRGGKDGEHGSLLPYVFGGALSTLADRGRELLAVTRLWRVSTREKSLLALAARGPGRRARELRQVQLDRMAHCLALAGFALISWSWTLECYLPAFYLALALVNVQNYYRHYGARPGDRAADSVSYYGRLYNLLAFNDGFHQEHHLSPGTHWSRMPEVRDRHCGALDSSGRIVSPVPAMVGFLHRGRSQLHREVILIAEGSS
jgi:fatty acid desaturase